MISDNLAGPLSKIASKSFTKMYDTDKVTIQKIFIDNWNDFLKDSEVIRRGLRPVVIKEVERMMNCGMLESGFEIYECPNCHKTHIIRYTGRPVMAESRIIKYDKNKKMILYYYEDHKTDERVEVEEDVITFMKKLIQHIPETQFKMIRYCGLYATCDHIHKPAMERMREKSRRPKKEFSYRREIIETFDTDPFLCDCGHYMEFIDYWVPPNRRSEERYEDTS